MASPVKFESSFATDILTMQKEQEEYLNNDLIRDVNSDSNRINRRGSRSSGTKAVLYGALAVLLGGAMVKGAELLPSADVAAIFAGANHGGSKPNPAPTLAPSATAAPGSYIGGPAISTGDAQTDALALDLYNKIKSNNLVMLTEGFKINNTLVTCDQSLVADAIAQLNNEVPTSMEGMNDSDYAIRMNIIGQFWATITEAAVNPNNSFNITIGDYVKNPTVSALVKNSEAVVENFLAEVDGYTPKATFASTPTENAKLNQPFKSNQDRLIGYMYQTEGDSVIQQMASPTANFVVFTMFTYGIQPMKDDAFIYEGMINGEKVRWPYIKYIEDVTGGCSYEAFVEADDRVSFIEYNAYGKKTGRKLSQNEMMELDKNSVNVVPQGFSTEMDNMKNIYMNSMQKKPTAVYKK